MFFLQQGQYICMRSCRHQSGWLRNMAEKRSCENQLSGPELLFIHGCTSAGHSGPHHTRKAGALYTRIWIKQEQFRTCENVLVLVVMLSSPLRHTAGAVQ